MALTRQGNELSNDLSNGLGNDRAAPGPEIAAAPDTSRSPYPTGTAPNERQSR